MYTNDFPDIFEDASIHVTQFADDNTISIISDKADDLLPNEHVSRSLAKNWFNYNKLCMNDEKTIRLIFALREHEHFTESESTKFLGLHIDKNLRWDVHVDSLAARICKHIYLLRNLTRCLTSKFLKTAYFALCHSLIAYGLLVWGHSSAANRIFSLQRRAVRILAGMGYMEDCRNVFCELGILTLPSQYVYDCLIWAKQHQSDYHTNNSFHQYDTRKNGQIRPPHSRLTLSQNGPRYYAPKLFNMLPENIKTLDLTKFKLKVKRYLLTKSYYSVTEFISDQHVL